MSKISKKIYEKKNIEHQKYLSRITKTLYYSRFPKPDGLSLPMTELAAELFSEAQRGHSLDRLHCDDAANISRNACVSPCSLVIALIYMERLKKICPEYLEKTASSELFLVSLMVSCKFLYDDGEADEVFIDEWALSGGTTVKNLVQLEKNFLKAIEWEVFVSKLAFWDKLHDIEKLLAKRQGCLRGFFTYAEVQSLLPTIDLQDILRHILSISAILIASYIAAVFALLGSVFIVSHIPGAYVNTERFDIGRQELAVETSIHILSELNDYSHSSMCVEDLRMEGEPSKNATLKVVKTRIFLSSLESFLKPPCNKSESGNMFDDNNVQNVSWDWWAIPALTWLYETASAIENIVDLPQVNFIYLQHLYDNYIQQKFLDLEDHIHKPTKIRIQDQLENSWHEEWTDTIKQGFHYSDLFHYTQNIKS